MRQLKYSSGGWFATRGLAGGCSLAGQGDVSVGMLVAGFVMDYTDAM